MNTFEKTTPTQETTPEVLEIAQSMREIDEIQLEAEESLTTATEYLDAQEAPLDNEKVGLLRSLGEKFKKSHLLKAAALGVTFMSVQPAFADNASLTLHSENSHQLNVDASQLNNSTGLRLRNMNRLRTPGLQPGQLSINGRNILPGQISHFNQKTLPNATINGGPAHEIAPGIYGDENTIYRQTSGGGTVLVGGISVD